MPRILTVDDSRAVRTIVAKQVKELGLEVDEAEDGQQALDKLEEIACDLILLDVTMPVMDGPTMLQKLRERGDKTPVIMLTSESKRSVVADAMKLGINDYILKPFKPEELMGKVKAALKYTPAPPNPAMGATAAPAENSTPSVSVASMGAVSMSAEPGELAVGKQFIDVMVVDDMENVAKRLRQLLPAHVTLVGFTSAQSALVSARERMCRVMLIDTEMPDVDSSALAGQLRVLQPHAAIVALMLKTTNDVTKELKELGFSDALFKPFTPESIEDFTMQYFDRQELLVREDNLLKLGAFTGKADRMERYVTRLSTLFPAALEQVAAACFESAIIDLSEAGAAADRLPKLLLSVVEKANSVGLTVRLVGAPAVTKVLGSFEETRTLPLYASVREARADG